MVRCSATNTPLRRSREEARRGMLIAQRRWKGLDPGLAPCLSFWSGAWGESFPPMMKNCLTVFFLRAFSRPGNLLLRVLPLRFRSGRTSPG
jgi:hypothetical protein